MATINFLIQGNNNPSGIYIRLKDGKHVDIKAKTLYSIDPENWSKTKGQPKNLKEANMKYLQGKLTSLSSELLNHYNNSVSNQTINTQWLKHFINPPVEENNIPNRLIDYFDYYELHKKTSLKKSTLTKLLVNKHLVQRFQQWAKIDFMIRDVNADFKQKFEKYCQIENYAPNTIARALKFIKTICYHAASHGVDTHYQLKSIITKTVKVEKIYLSQDEIVQISQTELEHDYLVNARDWLIISCETGQRVSDFMRFKSQMIRYEGKVPLIEFTQVKTGKIMAIPLSKRVRAILEKRGGEFPRKITDQRYNEYIKEVCKLSGIIRKIQGSKINPKTLRKETGHFPKYELVTSHIGRRSFATNNYGHIPTSLLINVTGHATESMFLEYIGKTVTEKAIQLAEYFES
ncbi:MAG: tyrosine-type recombinase/integrase [Chitinophagaceae bacterium]|jgi:integrase